MQQGGRADYMGDSSQETQLMRYLPTIPPPSKHTLLPPFALAAQPNVASSEVVATWTELSRCPYMSEVKAITHPGEVRGLVHVHVPVTMGVLFLCYVCGCVCMCMCL